MKSLLDHPSMLITYPTMKKIQKMTGWINLVIFMISVCAGIAVGTFFGQSFIGIMMGMGFGLTGITGFLYYVEQVLLRLEQVQKLENFSKKST